MTIITDYIATAPESAQPHLKAIYALAKELLPTAEERISYGMPTFYHGKNILHFAAAKNHLGFYPTPGPIEQFASELTGYKTSKGAVQFPYTKPLPEDLIRQMIAFRLTEMAK